MENENLKRCDWCTEEVTELNDIYGNWVKFANTEQERAQLCDECAASAFRCAASACGKLGDKYTSGVHGLGYCSDDCEEQSRQCTVSGCNNIIGKIGDQGGECTECSES